MSLLFKHVLQLCKCAQLQPSHWQVHRYVETKTRSENVAQIESYAKTHNFPAPNLHSSTISIENRFKRTTNYIKGLKINSETSKIRSRKAFVSCLRAQSSDRSCEKNHPSRHISLFYLNNNECNRSSWRIFNSCDNRRVAQLSMQLMARPLRR